jgi:tyrosyl-tRNA synthetase
LVVDGEEIVALPIEEQLDILMRGVEYGDAQTKEHMRQALQERLARSAKTGEPLRVYCGYDPTSADLHLGHTVTMRKLRQFQDLGHQAIFLIGTYTALIGDPSDKDKARPRPSKEEVFENARTYTEQAFKILDPERTEVRYNGEWLSELGFEQLIELASNFTIQQFLVRENFAKRQERGDPIWLHELFYALMQGYDAVALEADVQLGATEQLFNLMAGRKLQESFGQEPQVAVTLPILVGTDGTIRMSKSLGNYIGISEAPEAMYGKVMSIPDDAMSNYFNLVTRWSPDKIAELEGGMEAGDLHPMEAKKMLAAEIVDIFYGAEAAEAAAAHFARVHQQRKLPEDMPGVTLHEPKGLLDVMYEAELVPSKSQARRLIQQGAVRLDDEVIRDVYTEVEPKDQVLQVGKRRFLQILSAR